MLNKILAVGAGLFIALSAILALQFLGQNTTIQGVPEIAISPEPPPLDTEISDRLVARFIAEDPAIQSALTSTIPVVSATAEVASASKERRSDEDILFELMANWNYVKYRRASQLEEAQFTNLMTRKVTPYIKVGGTLDSATIVKLDSDRATVKLGSATQDLLHVPLVPPAIDPTVPRTPEQIALAQRIYYERVYKPAVVMGRKYNELAGRPRDMKIPPRAEQFKQANDYLDMMDQRVENSAPVEIPPETIVDPDTLTPKQREMYETYLKAVKRTPEEIRAAIEAQRELLRQRQAAEAAKNGSE
jgi:hypothetical protein